MEFHVLIWGGNAFAGNADGVANVTCAIDCAEGDSYVLNYSATVAADDPDLGGLMYKLYFTGVVGPVAAVPVPAAVWLFGSGLIGLAGFLRRRKVA